MKRQQAPSQLDHPISAIEAARYSGKSLSTIRRRIATGELESRKLGRRRWPTRRWVDLCFGSTLEVWAVVMAVLVSVAIVACLYDGGSVCHFMHEVGLHLRSRF